MEVSKIRLSPGEMELFCNAELILTKNRIIGKTVDLLAALQQQMVEAAPPEPVFSTPPKISRGENYLGLPYVVLDYPRRSVQGSLFFVRSMFWWGNFFSSTLHLSGHYADDLRPALIRHQARLAENNYYLGIHNDPWVHHFESSNYKPIAEMTPAEFQERIFAADHIKIAAKWPLQAWDSAARNLFESWKLMAALVA